MKHPTINKFVNKIICGDCLEIMRQLPDNFVNLVITSPPYYQQRNYGLGIGNEKTVEEYLENLLNVFSQCVRIVRNDGSIVFNIGDKYKNGSLLLVPYRFAIEALKREPVFLANIITWVKTNPTPRQYKKRLVNSTEPFFHFVKSKHYYYNPNEFLKEVNIKKEKNKTIQNNIGKKYFELIEKSSLTRSEKEKAKGELRQVIQEVKEGKINGFRMKIRGIHAEPFGGQEGGRKMQLKKKGFTIIKIFGNPIKRDVIECPVETIKGCKHPAIYPEYIVEELLKLLTRKGDLVLDPFIGSGTTAVACKKLGRNYIGIEINPSFCKYAEERIKKTIYQPSLL
jgi:site-specific DNA-methyltransferase (adenine-specific)